MTRFLTATILASALLPLARADDWPQWLGPQRDGVWREDGLVEKFPAGGPKVRWRQPIGPGYAGPAIVGDRIYVMDRGTDKPVLKDDFAKTAMAGTERVLCLDLATGKQIWKHEYDCPYQKLSYPSGPRTTPVIRDGRVYSHGAMGHLFCLSAGSGKVIWQKRLPEAYKCEHPIWGYAGQEGPRVAPDRKSGAE